MGIFKDIVSAAEIVGGAALIASGAGALAGIALIASGVASSGVIGGSVGKFLNSGAGQALIGAVGLGATAYAMFGQGVLAAGQVTEDTQMADVASTATGGETSAVAASAAGDANIPTGSAFASNNGASINGLATPPSAGTTGSEAGALNAAPTTGAGALSPQGSQFAPANNVSSTELATTAQPAGVGNGVGSENINAEEAGGNGLPQSAATANPVAADQSAAAGGSQGAPGGPGGGPPLGTVSGTNPDGTPLLYNGAPAPVGAPAGSASNGGAFSKLFGGGGGNGFGISPGAAAIQAGGSLVGGLGQGIMSKQAMQDQINAAQWAQRTYLNPTASAGVTGAAGGQTAVPNGYLARAAALRAMLNQPSNVAPVQQAGAAAPPPTMGGAPGGGPVPIMGLNQTTRGGLPMPTPGAV